MHLLAVLSLKNRALIALVTVVVGVFGVISFGSLKQELIPSIEIPQLAVVTVHPGASAEVVAQDVTVPVEAALQRVAGLEGTTATSSTGMSLVMAEFEFGTDTARVEQKMTQALSRITGTLPDDVEPTVTAISLDDFPVVQIGVTGGEASDLVDRLDRLVVPELERLDGVAAAEVVGAPGPRVSITPDPAALAGVGLDRTAIGAALAQNGILLPAGSVDQDGKTLSVQAGRRLTSVDQVAALPLIGASAAAPVQIGDVAQVELTADPTTSYSLVNGSRALTLSITKLPDANTVEVSQGVREALDDLAATVPGVTFDVLIDQAPFIQDSISALTSEGLLGLVFAVLVIWAFLRSGRATLVTAVSIPTSVLIAFVGMQGAGYTINILTLGGLTIAIGRIVDDSIVVIENVERHMSLGKPRRRAIVDAVREVAGAITASTITTVAVFAPIALVAGLAGVLFRPFAFTIAIAMGASLLVSLTIVPVLAHWFLRRRGHGRAQHVAAGGGTVDDGAVDDGAVDDGPIHGTLQRSYHRFLGWVVRHRWTTLGVASLVLVGTVALSPMLKTNFLGDSGQNSIGVTQQVAPGTSLDAQLRTATEVDEAIRAVDGVQTVQATVGSTPTSALLGGAESSIGYSITTDPDGDQTAIFEAVRAAVERLVDPDDVTVAPFASAGFSNDVVVSVSGGDEAALREGASIVADAMRALPEAAQVSDSLTQARPVLQVAVDRVAAARAGYSEVALGSMVSAMTSPQQIGSVTLDGSDVTVYLSPTTPPGSPAEVAALPVPTPAGVVPLSELAEVSAVDGPVSITTRNTVRTVTVTITPGSDDLGQASLAVSSALAGLDLPDGVSAEIGGITADQDEAFAQLGLAMLIAILIVYVVMVATFRSLLHPLLLLVSIPFAATGAVLLQLATGIPLGVASLIGVLMLIGIVVTNAIVLIDLVKQYRDRGMTMTRALMLGATRRVRPIVMTALATILALTPMAVGVTGHGGFISQPLAVVVIGGLLSSTLMTLVVLPALYHLVESVGNRGRMRTAEDL